MRRRRILAGLLLSLAAPLAGEAQPAGKIPRIGVLSPGNPPPSPDLGIDGLRLGLRELGYVENRTIVVESRWAEGRLDRQAALVSELIRLPVDVLE
jgi:putative tryptophan/tyrosine transport system substrate-binding protein